MSEPFAIPVVDISPYVSSPYAVGADADARAEVARRIDQACRTVGFIQVVGHGVPDRVLTGLTTALDDFFGNDLDTKLGYRMPPEVNRGYSPPRSESLSLSAGVEATANDYFEAFNVGSQAIDFPDLDLPQDQYPTNVWPDTPGFRERVEDYIGEAHRVAQTLTEIFGDALGLPAGWFAERTDHSLDVLRMINYALPPGTEVEADPTGMGAHTDYGIVTVLWADRVPGLQVVGPDGTWHDAMPAEGALLVNLGDIMGRFTNYEWMSTLHRVKPPVVDGTVQRRRSVAFFHDGNYDALVETVPSCRVPGAEEQPVLTVGDNIRAKLAGSRGGYANTADALTAERITRAEQGVGV